MQRTPVRAGAAALLAACAVLTAGPADAKPKPTAEQLGRQAEILTEEYNRTRLELKQAQQALRSAQRQLRQTQADYERLRGEIGELAAASYMSPGSRAELALFAGDDPQAGLDKDAISRYLTAQQAGRLRELVLARMRYEQNAGRARDRAAEIKAKQAELAKKKAKIEKLISQIPKSAGGQGSPPNISVAGSGKASGAVRAALTRVGMPYVYGAAGPNSFDCSGLMLWAYKQVGISLPHYTGAQYNMGTRVSRDQLRPGDIVFFYEDLGHNGMYIGNGRMVHAPRSGKNVEVVNLAGYWWGVYQGAVRIA
ncbi:C40 family peptidase [Thermomonospora cellulosilytica]|uniref:Cell wall-associated NlpC family hydrolase n=1 Tax=Thermomonospora cellulosilytica TaxID=1411118 RepID=A0A7W3R7N0_9ACTN|nr:NlpC/P60 family protein [Thermomonospora cellulosilytica]MBA9002806.1 cell wall-associated NlpC family hydrolase [Thermomonospora cellulosilytica]